MPLALRGQTIKKCNEPKVPIGALHQSSATIWYRLDKDARPDTGSVGVVTTTGISPGGARSIAVRILGACHFDLAKGTIVANGLVTQIQFDTGGVSFGTTDRVEAAPPLLSLDPFTLPPDSLPLPATDPRVDERPRMLKCQTIPPPSLRSTMSSGSSRAQAEAQALADIQRQVNDWNRMNTGELVADIVVRSDAKVEPAVNVKSSSNPAATSTLSNRIRSCSWIPARAHGMLIPVRMQAIMVVMPMMGPGQSQ
jgi:hypothetical protein